MVSFFVSPLLQLPVPIRSQTSDSIRIFGLSEELFDAPGHNESFARRVPIVASGLVGPEGLSACPCVGRTEIVIVT